jgi:chemotaxis protein methyltransferase WspC
MIEDIEALLKQKIGLDAESIGRSAVEYAVRTRKAACAIGVLAEYARHLQHSPAEQQALVDAVVVPETWFFRGPEAIDAMATIVQERRYRQGRPQRLLSLPCSTGEEPYSLAMALLDIGMPADMFRIDGIDISTRSIAAAEAAVYGRNSFRAKDLSFRDRYFEDVPGGVRPIEKVRQQVRFATGNLIDPLRTLAPASYDIIFCRNVLIYFDPPTQDSAVAMLFRLLTPDGLLFVGASEASLPIRQRFAPMRIPMAAAFCKDDAVKAGKPETRPAKAQRRPVPPPSFPVRKPALVAQPVAAAPPPAPVDPLDEVQRLADAGHIGEAILVGKQCLDRQGASPRIFYLLGLLSDASGDPQQAAAYYRKTLYLDPTHGEALAHLALLRQRQGDTAGAGALQGRLRRRGLAG